MGWLRKHRLALTTVLAICLILSVLLYVGVRRWLVRLSNSWAFAALAAAMATYSHDFSEMPDTLGPVVERGAYIVEGYDLRQQEGNKALYGDLPVYYLKGAEQGVVVAVTDIGGQPAYAILDSTTVSYVDRRQLYQVLKNDEMLRARTGQPTGWGQAVQAICGADYPVGGSAPPVTRAVPATHPAETNPAPEQTHRTPTTGAGGG
jgi:hypothetical protein